MPPGLESASLGETVIGKFQLRRVEGANNSMYIEMIQMINNYIIYSIYKCLSPLSLVGMAPITALCLIVYTSN